MCPIFLVLFACATSVIGNANFALSNNVNDER